MDNNTSPGHPPSTVIELEEKIMFQQRALDELNSVVLRQQTDLDRLGRELHALRTTVQQLIEHGGEDLPHEKPPHY